MNEYSYSDPEDYPPQPSDADGGTFAERGGLTVGPDDFPEPARLQRPLSLQRLALFSGAGLLVLVLLIGMLSSSRNNARREAGDQPSREEVPPVPAPPIEETPQPELSVPSTPAPSSTATIQKIATGVVRITAVSSKTDTGGTGTGFVINADGYILTNAHVVAPGDQYAVYFQDGHMAAAELIAANAELDAALLRVAENTNTMALPLGSSAGVQIGQKVFALGFPLGAKLGDEITVTDGIISSIRYQNDWFQISAAVNPGNSGGPLIRTETGEIIGLITAKIKDADNIGFARPIDACKDFIGQYTSFIQSLTIHRLGP